MKRKFNYLLSFLLLAGAAACTQNSSKQQNSSTENTLEKNSKTANTAKDPIKTDFKEGIMGVNITMPGSMLGKVLEKVDPAKGNVQEQMKNIGASLSATDRDKLQAESSKMGMMMMGLIMLPLKSTLYVKGNEVTAKMEALTYYGENYINNDKKSGLVYLKSRNSKNDVSFSYDEKNTYKMFAGTLSNKEYNISKTNETSVIAGYECSKSIYTAKNPSKADEVKPGETGTGEVYKVEVWTSTQMPQALNFVHPLYIEEGSGIMKLIIYPKKDSDLKLLYEVTNIESKSVSASDLAVKKTAKVYDYGKDIQTLGFKLMGIMMGV